LCTFASSSWGARNAFKKIVDQHRHLHRQEFPIVTLGTKSRNDEHGNTDPVFKAVAWVPISNFYSLLPEAAEKPCVEAPTAPVALAAPLAPGKTDIVPPPAPPAGDYVDGAVGVDPDDIVY
jgi:hypothetical protein